MYISARIQLTSLRRNRGLLSYCKYQIELQPMIWPSMEQRKKFSQAIKQIVLSMQCNTSRDHGWYPFRSSGKTISLNCTTLQQHNTKYMMPIANWKGTRIVTSVINWILKYVKLALLDQIKQMSTLSISAGNSCCDEKTGSACNK